MMETKENAVFLEFEVCWGFFWLGFWVCLCFLPLTGVIGRYWLVSICNRNLSHFWVLFMLFKTVWCRHQILQYMASKVTRGDSVKVDAVQIVHHYYLTLLFTHANKTVTIPQRAWKLPWLKSAVENNVFCGSFSSPAHRINQTKTLNLAQGLCQIVQEVFCYFPELSCKHGCNSSITYLAELVWISVWVTRRLPTGRSFPVVFFSRAEWSHAKADEMKPKWVFVS